ncbi:GTP cyclohydrolase I [Selenomonas sp. F0473]|uniref:GTP cyclohydrolase I n=1 Tax=Selenomonas sp. F0473 TaxID=999423 RepID=UPI00029E3641|nr:GTP cyclohydrolase I [Selenomonas sp. F0473]EKU71445.1 GTP cyclohydrolase I [Selenomonas sp. F0473]
MTEQNRPTAPDLDRAAAAMREFLAALGVDTAACGIEETPMRAAELYAELFAGVRGNPHALWADTLIEDADGLVAVRKIPFHSMCEHHLLPFFGTVDIVYRPRAGRVAGFGAFTELVACYAARPQLQERLTAQIADEIMSGLDALGVLVLVRARQLCMTMRGTHAHGTRTATAACRGAFGTDAVQSAQAWQMLGERA